MYYLHLIKHAVFSIIINTYTHPQVLLSPTTTSVVPFKYILTTADSAASRTASGVVLSSIIS